MTWETASFQLFARIKRRKEGGEKGPFLFLACKNRRNIRAFGLLFGRYQQTRLNGDKYCKKVLPSGGKNAIICRDNNQQTSKIRRVISYDL